MKKAKRIVMFLAVASLLATLAPQHARADWSEPSFISKVKQYELLTQWFPDVAEGPDGTLHAVWSDYDRTSVWPATAVIAIKYARSTDGGETWSQPVTVASTTFIYSIYSEGKLRIGDNGRIHLTFYYLNYYGYSRVHYANSDDNGQTWNVKYLQGGCFPWYVTPALDRSGNVFAAWERWKCGSSSLPNTVYFERSLDNGTTWEYPLAVSEGGVVHMGYQVTQSLAADDAGTLHLIYEYPGDAYSFGYGTSYYARSADQGTTWQLMQNAPESFTSAGIFSYGSILLIPGRFNDGDAFLRSLDGGVTWESPQAVVGLPSSYWPLSEIAVDADGRYYTWKEQSFVKSTDSGVTWSEPEYMGNGTFSKLLITRSGTIFAIGQFPCSDTDFCVGMVQYREPFGVDAPDFQSYWEKASFRYSFKVLGTGVVQVSFPADAVEVSPDVSVQVGEQSVPATVTTRDDRILVTVPVAAADWVSCSLPIFVKKGSMEKWTSLKEELHQLDREFIAAVEVEDGKRALHIDANRRALQEEFYSADREFVVSIFEDTVEKASDRTAVELYEKLTSMYAHLKANPPELGGATLLLKTADTVSLSYGEPFVLDVKVTHLKSGQVANVSLTGNAATSDYLATNATGTHKSTFYLFYPPTYEGGTDEIGINVTVGEQTTTIPLTIVLN